MRDARENNPARDDRQRRPDDRSERPDPRKHSLAAWKRLNRRHQRSWSPWLLIRYKVTDLGFRSVPSGEALHLSPDLSIESNDPFGRAVSGDENFVHARVFNLGKADALPTRVDFYWADPSIGLGPAHMNLIGREVVVVPAHTAVDVRCNTPWIPGFLNEGHECLKVNCTSNILDPITAPFQPDLDRHVGQRNITVLEGKAGTSLKFELAINNLFPMQAQSLVNARMEHVFVPAVALERSTFRQTINQVAAFSNGVTDRPAELRAGFAEMGSRHRQAAQLAALIDPDCPLRQEQSAGSLHVQAAIGSSSPCIGASLLDHSCICSKPARGESTLGRLLLAAENMPQATQDAGNQQAVLEVNLKGYEQRRAEFRLGIPGNAKSGEFVVFHLALVTEGLQTGGYTVIAQVSPGVARRQ